MTPYTPVEYLSQRLEYLEASYKKIIKLVLVVTYNVLPHEKTFEQYEMNGQDLKTALIMCEPLRRHVPQEVGDIPLLTSIKKVGRPQMLSFLQAPTMSSALYGMPCDGMAFIPHDDMSLIPHDGIPHDMPIEQIAMSPSKKIEPSISYIDRELLLLFNEIISNYSDHDDQASQLTEMIQAVKLWFLKKCKNRNITKGKDFPFIQFLRKVYKNYLLSLKLKVKLDDYMTKAKQLNEEIMELCKILQDIKDKIIELEISNRDLKLEKRKLKNELEKYKNLLNFLYEDRDRQLSKLKSYNKQLDQLKLEEREAYKRFEIRKMLSIEYGGDGLTKFEFMQLIPQINIAGQEYIEFVFPPGEFEELKQIANENNMKIDELIQKQQEINNKIFSIEQKINDITQQIIKGQELEINTNKIISTIEQNLNNIKSSIKKIKSLLKDIFAGKDKFEWSLVVDELSHLFHIKFPKNKKLRYQQKNIKP